LKKKTCNLSSAVVKEMFFSRCSSAMKIAVITHCREQRFSVAELVLLDQILRLGLTCSLEVGRRKGGVVVLTDKFHLQWYY